MAFAQEGGGGGDDGSEKEDNTGGDSEDGGDSDNPVTDGLSPTPTETPLTELSPTPTPTVTTPTPTPDGDCLFDPNLPKCDPGPDGECPDGFGMNEDGQCSLEVVVQKDITGQRVMKVVDEYPIRKDALKE